MPTTGIRNPLTMNVGATTYLPAGH